MNYQEEANKIRDDYKTRTRTFQTPFNDAVIAFLYLFACWMFSRKSK